MAEMLDIIDENNNVIGRETRERCFNEGLLHRAIHILILNSKGQVLLQKRSMKKKTFPGFWTSSVSGHVESGKSYEEGAIREMKEEIRAKTNLEKVCDFFIEEKYGILIDKEIIRLFSGKYDGPFSIDKNELDEVRFFYKEELNDLIRKEEIIVTPAFLKCWRKLNSKKLNL